MLDIFASINSSKLLYISFALSGNLLNSLIPLVEDFQPLKSFINWFNF